MGQQGIAMHAAECELMSTPKMRACDELHMLTAWLESYLARMALEAQIFERTSDENTFA